MGNKSPFDTLKDEDKGRLTALLTEAIATSTVRNVVGRYLFKKHCDAKMLRVREVQLIEMPNNSIRVNPLNSRYGYCIKCGHYEQVSGSKIGDFI